MPTTAATDLNHPSQYAKNHWRHHESSEDHADRVERAEQEAGRYFAGATVRQKAAYDAALSGLRGLHGPRYERARIAAKAVWARSTADARDLYEISADEIMRDGELSEETANLWDDLEAREAAALTQAAE